MNLAMYEGVAGNQLSFDPGAFIDNREAAASNLGRRKVVPVVFCDVFLPLRDDDE